MAVTLQTELGSLMFSSQIPDIVITTSDDNEVEELDVFLANSRHRDHHK